MAQELILRHMGFSIRSFGSWGEAPGVDPKEVANRLFQYPLFRIVG